MTTEQTPNDLPQLPPTPKTQGEIDPALFNELMGKVRAANTVQVVHVPKEDTTAKDAQSAAIQIDIAAAFSSKSSAKERAGETASRRVLLNPLRIARAARKVRRARQMYGLNR